MGNLAVTGGDKLRTKPFTGWPVHGTREKELVNEVLDSGKWWFGEKVREFEEKYAAYHDAEFGISTTNGTTALQTALASVGVGAGDEVLVPPYTFVATASSVLSVNGVPIFVDVDPETFNIDPEAIRRAISERTKAIVPVHFGGLPSDLDAIREIAEEHDLKIVEDAAHAWGTEWKGTKVGAIGDAGCFSFQMSKNITAGEGGIITTNNEEIADRCRSYSNCGRGTSGPWYEHLILGTNFRMTEIQAAILIAQLERLDDQVTARERNAKILDEGLSQIEGMRLLRSDPRVNRRSYHLYCFRYIQDEFDDVPRAKFLEALNAEGVPCSGGYPHPLYENPMFGNLGAGPKYCPYSCPYYGKPLDYSKMPCPGVEQVCQEALWFSQSVLLGPEEDMHDIVAAIRKIREHTRELK